jgi:DeoR/GlpR family transcriptional regulator of sugar metabolism
MKPTDRQRQILELARAQGRVDVATLTERLSVAPETVRRDLRFLVDRGAIKRTHGGAHPVESATFEATLLHRSTSQLPEKRRIAETAYAQLLGAESIYLDEGVTPQLVAAVIARRHPGGQPLTVVTPSVPAATTLADHPDVTVMVLGGQVRGLTLATVDHWTTQMLSSLFLDLAVIGANGVSRDQGLTTPDPEVAAVKSLAISRSRRRICVAASSRFGVASFCRFADLDGFESLVTDSGLSATEAQRYTAVGPRVIRA